MHNENTAPMLRKIFATVTNAEFAAFLTKAKAEGHITSDDRPDINGALKDLIIAFVEDRIVILSAHDVKEVKKKIAKEILEKKHFYGKEHTDDQVGSV